MDPAAGRCLAARDGMGNRLASYVLRPEVFAVSVGTEGGGAAALLDLPGVSSEADGLRLAAFYAFCEVTGNETFFRDVRHLMPGEMLVVESAAVRRRWLPRPRLDLRLNPLSFDEAAEELAGLLRRSVARVLRDHEHAAVWLSGGLDSAPIAALAAELLPSRLGGPRLHAVSWTVPDAGGDEGAFVETMSRERNIPLSWVDCGDALAFADLASWPVHPASPEQTALRWFHERGYARARALGAEVVLVGFGGDQLYLDARRWFWTLLRADGPGPAIERLREAAAIEGWRKSIRSHVVSPLLPKRRRRRRFLPSWLTPATRARLEARPPWPRDVVHALRPRQAERALALLDAHGEHLEAWYAARHCLELAEPLRDFDLVQFLLAVPDHYLRQGVESRPILRHATRRLLPEVVRRRSGKATFRGILLRGFEGERLAWAAPLLRSTDALWREHVESAAVERWLAGDFRDDWDRIGLLNCIYGELWRFSRAGGELRSLVASPPS